MDDEFYHACYRGDVEQVKRILQGYPTLNVNKQKHITPLIAACQNGHLLVVQELLKQPSIIVNSPLCASWGPLRAAIYFNYHSVAVELLHHPDIEVEMEGESKGYSHLEMALGHRDVELVIELLRHPKVRIANQKFPSFRPYDDDQYRHFPHVLRIQLVLFLVVVTQTQRVKMKSPFRLLPFDLVRKLCKDFLLLPMI